MEELKEGGMDEGKHPAGSQSQWQSDRWRGLAPNVCFLRVCLYASASKCEQGLGDGGSPVQLMSWQVGPPPPSLPKTLTPPHILSPNTATQGPTSFPDSFFYSISGFNLVGAAPLRSRPWADVWQLKDSHLVILVPEELGMAVSNAGRSENCWGFDSWSISTLRVREHHMMFVLEAVGRNDNDLSFIVLTVQVFNEIGRDLFSNVLTLSLPFSIDREFSCFRWVLKTPHHLFSFDLHFRS